MRHERRGGAGAPVAPRGAGDERASVGAPRRGRLLHRLSSAVKHLWPLETMETDRRVGGLVERQRQLPYRSRGGEERL